MFGNKQDKERIAQLEKDFERLRQIALQEIKQALIDLETDHDFSYTGGILGLALKTNLISHEEFTTYYKEAERLKKMRFPEYLKRKEAERKARKIEYDKEVAAKKAELENKKQGS